MTELKDGCVKPAKGSILPTAQANSQTETAAQIQEVAVMTARVGKEAIDFEAKAYVEGKGFQRVRLSDYKGKWVVLCFCPGAFTCV